MLNFPVKGGTSSAKNAVRVFPMECAMISGPSIQSPAVNQVLEEKINIAIHPEYPEQTVAIGSTLNDKGLRHSISLPFSEMIKECMHVNGKLAKITTESFQNQQEKSLPFFKIEKCTKKSDFLLDTKAIEAFQADEGNIAELPTLTAQGK
ncbi:hypothetical protein Tco_0031655 [Tanacetum coccineum]